MLKEALGSLLRRRYNIYSVSPGMLRSVYCPPIPQCWCLIFKTSILPRDLRHQPRNTLQVQNPWASPVRAEGRRSRSASFLPLPRAREGGLFHFSRFLGILRHFYYYSIRPERRGKKYGLLWRKHNVSDLPRTCPRRRGKGRLFILQILICEITACVWWNKYCLVWRELQKHFEIASARRESLSGI